MKNLWLVRHAKSSWKDAALRDYDRPLNKRGHRDAPQMGQRLAGADLKPDLLVASPAIRAKTTARIIAAEIGYDAETILWDERIYHASTGELVRLIREVDDAVRGAMFFGHNPTMTYAANALTGSSIENIPTCGVVLMQFAIDSWSNIGDGAGSLLDFDYPKRDPSQA